MESIPLSLSDDGLILVGGTRVTLDSVVAAFQEGATAEEIVFQYPSLVLADVYAVLGYYLRHRQDVEGYLAQRAERVVSVREQNEQKFPPSGVRQRLLARQSESKS